MESESWEYFPSGRPSGRTFFFAISFFSFHVLRVYLVQYKSTIVATYLAQGRALVWFCKIYICTIVGLVTYEYVMLRV